MLTCAILKIDFLQNNEIATFKRGTFHSQANPDLCILDLSFNSITSIPYDTFRFPRLERLLLDDNQIWDIDSKVKSVQNAVSIWVYLIMINKLTYLSKSTITVGMFLKNTAVHSVAFSTITV
jgi:Leucine-rich repeat (LRR) protein